jgi:hypothetical protein
MSKQKRKPRLQSKPVRRKQQAAPSRDELEAQSLSVASPEIGAKPPPIPRSAHRLRHTWEAKRGQPPAFTLEREGELQRLLEAWLRQQPKPPKLDDAVGFVLEKMPDAEKARIQPSTVKTRIVRPVYSEKSYQ